MPDSSIQITVSLLSHCWSSGFTTLADFSPHPAAANAANKAKTAIKCLFVFMIRTPGAHCASILSIFPPRPAKIKPQSALIPAFTLQK